MPKSAQNKISKPKATFEGLLNEGREALRQRRYKAALPFLSEAQQLAASLSPASQAYIDGLLGYTLHKLDRLEDAKPHFERAASTWDKDEVPDNLASKAGFYSNFGEFLTSCGEFARARAYLERSQLIDSQIDTPPNDKARTALNMARTYVDDMPQHALWLANESFRVLRSGAPEDKYDALHALNVSGIALLKVDRYEEALRAFEEVAQAQEADFDLVLLEQAKNNIGIIRFTLGDYKAALEAQTEALHLHRKRSRNRPTLTSGTLLTNLGAAFHKLGDFHAARTQHRRALKELAALGLVPVHPLIIRARKNLGAALFRLELYEHARTQFQTALALQRQRPKEYDETGDILLHLGELAFAQESYQKASSYAQEALATMAKGKQLPSTLWRGWSLLSRALFAQGNHALAIMFAKEAVNDLQELRESASPFSDQIQDTFLSNHIEPYHTLQAFLLRQNRKKEAAAVTGLRPVEERHLLGRSSAVLHPLARIAFTVEEETLRSQWDDLSGAPNDD